jgi:superfamily II DNA or RNA helicase
VISRAAIAAFLARPLKDSAKAKAFTPEAIDAKLEALETLPRFYTPPLYHCQKVCFLLGLMRPRYMFLLDPGLGKALPNDELVLTPSGFVRMDSLRVGDLVVGSNGDPTAVTGVFPQGRKKVYKVTFSDGSAVKSCEDHLWTVCRCARPRGDYKWETKPLKAFKDDLRGKPSKSAPAGYRKWFIPLAEPIQFWGGEALPIPPYALGVLLGDGSITPNTCGFSTNDQFISDEMRRVLPSSMGMTCYASKHPTYREWGITKCMKLIEQLKVNVKSPQRFVPDIYLKASVEGRHAILQGLLDTDGTATKQGCFNFCSMSEQLARDVVFLARSLGGVAKFKPYKIKSNFAGCTGKTAYDVIGRLPQCFAPFRLPRKQSIINQGKLKPYRAIVSVEEVGEEECRCISVAAPDGLFVANDFVVTHNTWISLNLFAYRKMLEQSQRKLVLVPFGANLDAWYKQVKLHTPKLSVEIGVDRKTNIEDVNADIVVLTYSGFLGLVSEGKPVEDEDGNDTGQTKGWQCDEKKLRAFQRHFDCVTFDEMGMLLGNHDTLLTRTVRKLVKNIPVRYGLTGTPFGKEPMRAWSQFDILDDGETFGETLGMFREVFYNSKPGYFGGTEYSFRRDRIDEFNRTLRHGSIRYAEDEVHDLPATVYNEVEVKWPEETWAYYERVVEDLKAARGNFRAVDNAFIRMRQLTAGFLSFTDGQGGKHEVVFKTNPKMDALMAWAKAIPYDRKGIIFVDLVKTGDLVSQRLTKEKLKHSRLYSGTKDKAEQIDRFEKDPDIRFLVSSKSGGIGLNLQFSNYIGFYESPTPPDIRKQMEARQRRTGQIRTPFVTDFIMRASVDRKILNSIATGQDLFKSLVEGGVYVEGE